jgi:hypothetical protein
MKRVLLLSAFLLAACGKPEDDGALKAAFAASALKDPSSVQFRNVKANSEVICGEYNSKNSYGAYSGFEPFVFKRSINDLWLGDGDNSYSSSAFWKECPNAAELSLSGGPSAADMNATDTNMVMNAADEALNAAGVAVNAAGEEVSAASNAVDEEASDDAPIPDNYVYDANNDAGE